MKVKDEVAALNARIPVQLRRAFDVAVAQRGITKQQAVEEALLTWVHQASSAEALPPFPLFASKSERRFNLIREQIDEASIG